MYTIIEMLQCGHGRNAVENEDAKRKEEEARSASMRPRQERRGERGRDSNDNSSNAKLQCGHGRNAVENILKPPPLISLDVLLQCGHGRNAVENHSFT